MAMILDVENLELPPLSDKWGLTLLTLINALVARGWTVEGSGDGVSTFKRQGQTAGPYNVFSGHYSTGGAAWNSTTALSISNTYAWFIIKEPAPSTREFVIQRTSSTSTTFMWHLINLRMATNGYVQSGCSATTVNMTPAGGGVSGMAEVTGSGIAMLGTPSETVSNAYTSYLNILISDSARAGNVWPFYMTCWNSTISARAGEWVYESLVDTPDTQPYVFKADNSTTCLGASTSSSGFNAWHSVNTVSGTLDTATSLNVIHSSTLPGTFATNQVPSAADGKVRAFPVQIFGSTGGASYKGTMEHLYFNPRARDYPNTTNLAEANPRLAVGMLLLPWKQNVVPAF